MSWFMSLFSTPQSTPPPITTRERILEEPVPEPPRAELVPKSTIPTNTAKDLSSQPSLPDERNTRPNRNKIIFGAGLGFFALSMLITRRAFARKRLASQAAFYADAPGHHIEQSKKVSGAMEALEALNIATINVLSLTMMATGGALWYLDINSMQDARRMLRGGLGVDGSGRDEKEAEEEFEEWMAATLSRKEAKEKRKQEDK